MNKKERIIINNKLYNFDELEWIWYYFKENGVPTYGPRGFELRKPYDLEVAHQYLTNDYDDIYDAANSLDVEYLAKEYVRLDEEFKKVKAQLELKGRKPLTKAQFDSKAYDDYLKAFDAETKRLKKEAGLNEE